jgi:hypothetical protein
LLGPLDSNGLECPVYCPVHCGKDMKYCPGGDDPTGGCMYPDFCMSMDQECPINDAKWLRNLK